LGAPPIVASGFNALGQAGAAAKAGSKSLKNAGYLQNLEYKDPRNYANNNDYLADVYSAYLI
jgi:hypothetical protein